MLACGAAEHTHSMSPTAWPRGTRRTMPRSSGASPTSSSTERRRRTRSARSRPRGLAELASNSTSSPTASAGASATASTTLLWKKRSAGGGAVPPSALGAGAGREMKPNSAPTLDTRPTPTVPRGRRCEAPADGRAVCGRLWPLAGWAGRPPRREGRRSCGMRAPASGIGGDGASLPASRIAVWDCVRPCAVCGRAAGPFRFTGCSSAAPRVGYSRGFVPAAMRPPGRGAGSEGLGGVHATGTGACAGAGAWPSATCGCAFDAALAGALDQRGARRQARGARGWERPLECSGAAARTSALRLLCRHRRRLDGDLVVIGAVAQPRGHAVEMWACRGVYRARTFFAPLISVSSLLARPCPALATMTQGSGSGRAPAASTPCWWT